MNLEKYLIDFDALKEGDSVWSIQEGDCKVSFIENDIENDYQISVNGVTNYKKDGKIRTTDNMPSLFKSNPFEAISEYPKMMEVSADNKKWTIRKVIWETSKIFTALDLEEEFTTHWIYAREINPKKVTLTLEQIAKLANCNVEDLEIN